MWQRKLDPNYEKQKCLHIFQKIAFESGASQLKDNQLSKNNRNLDLNDAYAIFKSANRLIQFNPVLFIECQNITNVISRHLIQSNLLLYNHNPLNSDSLHFKSVQFIQSQLKQLHRNFCLIYSPILTMPKTIVETKNSVTGRNLWQNQFEEG